MALSHALNLDLAGFDRRHNRKNWDMGDCSRVAVALAPFAHGHPSALFEEPVQGDVGAESAEVGDRAHGHVRAGEEREGLFEADMQDFLKRRMAYRLAEAAVEKRARAAEAAGEGGDGQAIAGLAANDLDGFQDERLAPTETAGGFAAQCQKRFDGDFMQCGGVVASLGDCLGGEVSGQLVVNQDA